MNGLTPGGKNQSNHPNPFLVTVAGSDPSFGAVFKKTSAEVRIITSRSLPRAWKGPVQVKDPSCEVRVEVKSTPVQRLSYERMCS